MTKENLVISINGDSLLHNLRKINQQLVNSSEIEKLTVGESQQAYMTDADDTEILVALTPILHPKLNDPLMYLGFGKFLVAPDDRREGYVTVNELAGQSFHVITDVNNQWSTFVHIYTECLNCLVINLASSYFDEGEL